MQLLLLDLIKLNSKSTFASLVLFNYIFFFFLQNKSNIRQSAIVVCWCFIGRSEANRGYDFELRLIQERITTWFNIEMCVCNQEWLRLFSLTTLMWSTVNFVFLLRRNITRQVHLQPVGHVTSSVTYVDAQMWKEVFPRYFAMCLHINTSYKTPPGSVKTF